jgi:hypothetical protein
MYAKGWEAEGGEKEWRSSTFPAVALPQCTFLFEVFCFFESVGDVRGFTFDHSARHEPASPGFPVLISRVSSYKGWSRV